MNRKTTCLLLWATTFAGCSSTAKMSAWDSKNVNSPPAAVEKKETPPATQASLPANPRAETPDEHIKAGQTEIAAWYGDQQARHLPTAKMHFEAVLAQSPQNARAHHGLAIVADLEKNYALAERHYQEALVQNPGDSDILGDLGYSYLLQNRLSESEQYSLRALQTNPGNQKAIKHLGDVYARQGKTQQAQETYAKVLSAPDVQKALADNPPSKNAQRPDAPPPVQTTLLEKMIPGKSTAEKVADEIRAKQEARGEAQRTAGNAPGAPPPFLTQQDRLNRDRALREQMAAIDQEAYSQNHQSGPIMIDDQTRQITRLPGGEANGAWSQGANLPMSSSVIVPAGQNSPDANSYPPQNAPQQQGWGQQPYHTNAPSYNSNYPGNGSSAAANGFARNSTAPTPNQGFDPNQRASAGRPNPQQPWTGIPVPQQQQQQQNYDSQVNYAYQQSMNGGNAVTQAGGQSLPANSQMPQQNWGAPNNAQQPGAGPNSQNMMPSNQGQYAQNSMGSGSQPPNGMTARPGSMTTQPPGPGSAGGDPYQDASRAAARMGMGLGPGSMFPVIGQAAPVNPPGTMTYEQANVPPPRRDMPDERPIQNLNLAYQPDSTPNIPPAFTQGGQMPPNVTPMYSRQQYNNEMRQDAQTMMNSNIPESSWNAMQGYEAQRWKAGQEQNMAVQQIWGQGPVNSPLSPSAGSQYSYPTAQGVTYTPNPPAQPGDLHPPAWPYPQQAVPDQSVIDAERANPGNPAVAWDPSQQGQPQQGQASQGQYPQGQNQRGQAQGMQQQGFPQQNFPQQNFQQSSFPQPGQPQYQQQGAPQQSSQNGRAQQQPNSGMTIPPEYRTRSTQNAANSTPATSAGQGADNQFWPTIRPQSR
ncbi:tetratricopeptide repeat protein [Planctomicrobium piriforme]|uniref:Tetratricopeptide repeat-containing protein n=1 Tax=Planctomicrobium piriforme TaxID=1576369 RepID=A0A1I3BJY1_9PLAN|nr:tetratricopeptide repeat protein [Planctomicrobium piriforme]SFH62634.1 Tetratricopeptide repeat-containing protein [Planctomicrobium piriforme]